MTQPLPDADRRKGANGGGRRVYELLRAQIADGTLKAGAKAPSTRSLAEALGVARSTVTAAYEQLAAEGFLATSLGRVARIAAPLVLIAARTTPGALSNPVPAISDFGRRLAGMNVPPVPPQKAVRINFLYGAVASRDFPSLAWKRAYQAELLKQQEHLYYSVPEGDVALRQALQSYLRRARGLHCSAEQILIVHGTQQAVDLCARLLLNSDDAYVFENPGYLMARHCFEASGAKLIAVPVDGQGMKTDQLPTDSHVKLAYVTPSHQFPLGGVLPITRRMELLDWAKRENSWILEDDYDGEFRYGQHPIDALQAIDSDGRVIYVGTFSKALSPQLRLAYMVLPHSLVALFRKGKRLADRHAPVLEQRVLASILQSGAYERHIRRIRRENERRRAALLEAIKQHLPSDAKVDGTAAGLHIVLWLPSLHPKHESSLVNLARDAGIGIYAVSPLYLGESSTEQPRPAGLTVGYASLTLEQIENGIIILAQVIRSMTESQSIGVC